MAVQFRLLTKLNQANDQTENNLSGWIIHDSGSRTPPQTPKDLNIVILARINPFTLRC